MLIESVLLALSGLAGDAVPSRADSPESFKSLPLRAGPRWRVFGGAALGKGLRFNNPYRLDRQLGDSAESVSVAATYVDLFVGTAFDTLGPLQHGPVVHLSIATDGVRQEVVAPSYAVMLQPAPRWLLLGRFGLPIVVEPDSNLGWEVGVGGALFATAGVALTAELAASVFYGAATLDTPRTTIPVVALQLGVMFDYEVYP